MRGEVGPLRSGSPVERAEHISLLYFNIPRGSSRTTASYNLQGKNPVLPGKTRVCPSRLDFFQFGRAGYIYI